MRNESRGDIFCGINFCFYICQVVWRAQGNKLRKLWSHIIQLLCSKMIYRASWIIMLRNLIIWSSKFWGFVPIEIQYSCLVKQDTYRQCSYMEFRYLKSIKKWSQMDSRRKTLEIRPSLHSFVRAFLCSINIMHIYVYIYIYIIHEFKVTTPIVGCFPSGSTERFSRQRLHGLWQLGQLLYFQIVWGRG